MSRCHSDPFQRNENDPKGSGTFQFPRRPSGAGDQRPACQVPSLQLTSHDDCSTHAGSPYVGSKRFECRSYTCESELLRTDDEKNSAPIQSAVMTFRSSLNTIGTEINALATANNLSTAQTTLKCHQHRDSNADHRRLEDTYVMPTRPLTRRDGTPSTRCSTRRTATC